MPSESFIRALDALKVVERRLKREIEEMTRVPDAVVSVTRVWEDRVEVKVDRGNSSRCFTVPKSRWEEVMSRVARGESSDPDIATILEVLHDESKRNQYMKFKLHLLEVSDAVRRALQELRVSDNA